MHTQIYTYFTKPNGKSELLYSAEDWVRAKFILETAGPVSVGTREDVAPVLSGKGILIPPSGEPLEFFLPKGDRIFIAANATNRVKFIVEPIPWFAKISYQISQVVSAVGNLRFLGRGSGGGSSRRTPTSNDDGTPCPPK